MQGLRSYVSADGTRYHIPQNETEAFEADFGSEAQTAKRYRTKDGQSYTIPASEDEGFRADFPDAVETRQMQMADGTKREFSMPELSRFLRSKEYRESDDYKKPEQGSVAWAGLKGGAEGAVTGAYHGAKSAAGKILAALPEAAASVEEAAGNLISGGGNKPNAVGEWLRNNARAQKRWLGENIKGDVYDENGNVVTSGLEKNLGYTDDLVKLGELSGDAAAMAVKFAPAAVAGPLYTDIILASDGINAYRESYDAATQAGFGAGAANLAGAAAGLINYYGGKLLMGSGAAGNLASGPMGKFLLSGLASAGAMGLQKAGSKGVENFIQGRPGFEGQIGAFGEGAIEGGAFHLVNAVGHGWSEAMAARKETAQLKEMRKENLLTVAGEKYGGEFLNRIIQNEGMDSAVKARRKGEDVSRKMGQKADLPDNMSVEERNAVVDAIIEARDAQAAANWAKISDEQSLALDEAIKEVYGTEGYEKTIRNNVLAKIKDAKVLDDPEARGRLVEEAAAEVEKAIAERDAKKLEEAKRQKTFPAEDAKYVESGTIIELPDGTQLVRTSRGHSKWERVGAPENAIALADSAAEEMLKDGFRIVKEPPKPKRAKEPAKATEKPAENAEPPKTGNEPSKPAEGVEVPSRASGEAYVPEAGRDDLKVQGTDYTVGKAKELLREDVAAKIAEAAEELGVDLKVKGVELHGSRVRGDAKKDSDLDLVVEYEGDAREDTLWEILNEKPTVFGGIKVDINPINAEKSGTLSEYMRRSAEYDAEKMAKPKPDGKGKMVKSEPKVEPPATTKKTPVFTKENYDASVEAIRQGKPVNLEGFPKGEASAYNQDGEWRVIDAKTGARMGAGRTKKEAVANAEAKIKAVGPENMAERLKTMREAFETAKDLYEPHGVRNPKFVEWVEKYAADKLAKEPKEGIPDKATEDAVRLSYAMEALEEAGWTRMTSKENVSALFDVFKSLVEKNPPERDSNGTVTATNVRRVAYEIEQSKFSTEEQKAFAHKYGEKYAATADKPVPDGKGKMVKPAAKKHAKVDAKKAAKIVMDFAGKDDTRVALRRIHHDHDEGVAVASDGRVLIATKHGYDPNVKNDPDYPYPNWKQVVPKYKDVEPTKIDPVEISALCKKAKALANKIGYKGNGLVQMELANGERILMDATNLKRVADAMAANGMTEIIGPNGKSPILAKNGDTTIVAMPQAIERAKSGSGRGDYDFIIDAKTGRIISAPERASGYKYEKEYIETLRKSGALKNIKEAEKLEKRIAAEDEIDALMAEAAKPTATKKPPKAEEPEQVELRKAFKKTVSDRLGDEGETADENLRDAAEALVDTIRERYEDDANADKICKALDKALEKFYDDNPKGRRINPADAAESLQRFADELAEKYDIPGYNGRIEAPEFRGKEIGVGTVDDLRRDLFYRRLEYNWSGAEGLFDDIPFRKIDAEKLTEADKKALTGLENDFSEALKKFTDSIDFDANGKATWNFDEEMAAFEEAKANLNRFLEQAEKYQALKRDKSGRPIYSPAEPAKGTVSDTIEELDRLIAAEEKGDSGAAGAGAEGLPARSQSWEPGKGVSRVKAFFGGLVSKNSIVRTIKDVFPEFAIRPQNTTRIGKNYSGHFEPWRELIRSKDISSIDTIPHEIGHGISMRTKRKAMVIPQEAKRELAKMGRDLYGTLKPTSGYMEEGWAEFVRGYMTGADNLATECPALNKWFIEKFTPAHPNYVKKIDRVRKEVLRYRIQSDLQRAAAEQRPETSAVRRAWDKVTDVFSAENWNDEGATLTRGYKDSGLDKMHEWQAEFRELEKLQKKGEGNSQRAHELAASISEKVLSDPRIFASNARGTSKARTMDMMKYGITNLSGTEKIGDVVGFDTNGKAIRNDNTESYRDIFRDFSNNELADWDLYAAAKIGLENYVKKGKEFGVDKASLERRVAALESEKFLDALERFTKMSRRALSVGLEAGALTPEQYKKIVGEHKYYVRTERRLAEDGAGGGKGQQNPLHKIKGSTKNIMPPRIATMMQIERQLKYFQTMKVLNMIAKDVLKAERANAEFHKKGTGQEYQIAANLPVKVANAQEAVKFGSEKLRKEVTRRMNEAGVTDPNEWAGDKTAADALFDQLFNGGEDTLTVFRERPSNGKNGLVSTYIDGKLVTFELPDAKWAKYITGMETGFDNGPSGKVWDVITAPGKALRFGATTANPVFATANFVRDAFHSAIMSDTGAKPMVSSVVGMVDDMLGMDAGRLFKSMGGEMSMLMGSNKEAQFKHMQNAALADNILEQIAADTSVRNPLSGILRVYTDLLSKPEMGPRVREVRGVMKKAQAAGLDREAAAWLAFAAGKDVSVDFGKHGRFMKVLNQVIPYTNAWYRGLEQFSRNLGLTKALPTQFEERGGVRAARTVGRGLMYLSSVAVANSIANMLMMAEKERREQFNKTPREKWEYDDILGAVRMPMPFELGAVFYAIPKAIVYEAFGDKGAVKEAIWHGLSTNLGKYSSVEDFTSGITTIAPFVDMLRNKKWDGAPIVSPHIMDAYPKDRQMWYDHSTTEIAKWVGEKLDWAPAHVDHVANTWSGGMWKRLFSPAADTTLMTQTGFSTFRPRPAARRDVHDFYDFRSEAQSHYNAGTASIEDVGRLARANKLHEKLSPLFKEARELGSSGLDATERRKRRDEIMETVFDAIHEFNVAEADDRRGGLAKAAVALTNGVELEDAVRTKNLAVLKGVPFEEIADALRAYGREKVQTAVKNSRGYKTGRIKTHRRWEPETISKRIKLLRRALNDQ